MSTKKSFKTANDLRPKMPFFIVEKKELFPNKASYTDIFKCDIARDKVKSMVLSDDEREVELNGRHSLTFSGKLNYVVGDVLCDEELAYEQMGAFLEENMKAAEKNLAKAKEEVEALTNLRKLHDKMSANNLGFDKEGKDLKLTQKED